jgi:TIR domain
VSDIFISYAREDLRRAKQLAEAFEAQGWSVFWDRYIPPGETWHAVIDRELQAARCVVVAWSKASIQSGWVYEEADEGREDL